MIDFEYIAIKEEDSGYYLGGSHKSQGRASLLIANQHQADSDQFGGI